MILKHVMFFLFTLSIFLPFTKLLCHPQNIILTPQSTEYSFMNDTIPCHGCRKLFSYNITTKELVEKETNHDETTTLLKDIINANVDFDDGKHELFGAANLKEFKISGGTNSIIRSLTGLSEDPRSLVSSSHSSVVTVQMEVLSNERNREGLEGTRPSNLKRFSDSRETYSVIGSLSEKGVDKSESHLWKQDKRDSTDKNYSEVPAGEMPIYLKLNKNEFEVNSLQTHAYTERLETEHKNLTKSLLVEPHYMQLNTEEGFASLSLNFKEVSVNGVPGKKPIKIRKKRSELVNEAPKISTPNQDNSANFDVSYFTTELTMGALQNNKNLQENTEMTNKIQSMMWKPVNNNFLERNHQINELMKVPRQENNEWNRKLEESNFHTSYRDIKSSKRNFVTNVNGVLIENLNASENEDSFTKSPTVVTNVNGVVIEGKFEVSTSLDLKTESPIVTNVNGVVIEERLVKSADAISESPPILTDVNSSVTEGMTKIRKINKTMNLFQEESAAECEKGSGSCLKCREISPKCHYNFRSKLCFFADVVHGNVIYECGIRFFTADNYQPFWIALAILIISSSIVLFFLARAFYKRILQKDPITDMEVEDVRNIVHLIKDKRGV